MVQSFKAVNLDKREFVCPWCMNEGATLRQWTAGHHSGIFTLLMSESSLDCQDTDRSPSYVIASADRRVIIAEVSHKSIFKEEPPTPSAGSSLIGRWAGDRVCLLGDESDLWHELPSYTNITEQVVRGWNDYLSGENAQVEFRHCGCSSVNLDETDQP